MAAIFRRVGASLSAASWMKMKRFGQSSSRRIAEGRRHDIEPATDRGRACALFLRRNIWRILTAGAVFGALSYLAAVFVFDRYVATAVVRADVGGDPRAIESLVQAARSDAFYGALVDELHLTTDAEFAGKDPRATIDNLAARLTLARRGESDVVDVAASTRSAEKSARIANAAARRILDDQARLRATHGAEGRLAVLRARIDRAEQAAAELKARLRLTGPHNAQNGSDDLGAQLLKLNEFEREAREQREACRQALDGQGELAQAMPSELRIVSPATTPTGRTPRRLLLAAPAALLGLLAGLVYVIARERRRDALTTSAQAARLGTRPIVFAPLLDVSAAHDATPDLTPWLSELCAALAPTGARKEAPLILVASARRGEGRTTIAANVATWFAQGGDRVLLVEADRPRAGQQRARYGLLDVLESGEDLRSAFIEPTGDDYTLLPFGGRARGRRAVAVGPLMTGLTLRALLRLARQWFDLVIVDGPPALEAGYARALATQADDAVFVAQWDQTSAADVRAALDELDLSGAAFVYNRADAGRLRLFEPAQARRIIARKAEDESAA